MCPESTARGNSSGRQNHVCINPAEKGDNYVMIVCKVWGGDKWSGCFPGPVTKGTWFPDNLKVLKVSLQM